MLLWSESIQFNTFKTVFHGRKAGPDGSVDSTKVSGIMKSIGQNPSEAEIQVKIRIGLFAVIFRLFGGYGESGR